MKVSYAEFLDACAFDGTKSALLDVEASEIACTARFGVGFRRMHAMFLEKAGLSSDFLEGSAFPKNLSDLVYTNATIVRKLAPDEDDGYGWVGRNLTIELL